MNIDLALSADKFHDQLREFLRVTRRLGQDFLTPQMRLLLQVIVRFTPPKNKKQGEGAVVRDIAKTVQPFAVDEFRNPALAAIVEEGDFQAFEVFSRRVSNDKLRNVQAAPFSPTLHSSRRDRRGRIASKRSRPTFVLGRADRAELAKYIKRKRSNVGIAKSGWLAATQLLGGSVPAWVSRHGTAYGSVIDERNDQYAPGVTAINRTPWAQNREEGNRIIASAMRSRINSMSTDLSRRIRDEARRIGLAA